MSEQSERIRAAAARDEAKAETEQPEEEQEAEQEETEQPPAPEQPEQPEQPEGGLQAEQAHELEKATTAYMKRVQKVFGADSMPPECPHCMGLGFDLTGGADAPPFLPHEQFKACPECDGFGNVLTGSKVPGNDLQACPKCVGRGYLERQTVAGPDGNTQVSYGSPAWLGQAQPAPASAPPAGNSGVPAWQGDPNL